MIANDARTSCLRFGETETDGGRDLVRAAELTPDPLLRRLYLAHAEDELRHGEMFRRRGSELLHALPPGSTPGFQANWLAPSGHGVDDLSVDGRDDRLARVPPFIGEGRRGPLYRLSQTCWKATRQRVRFLRRSCVTRCFT